MTKKIFISAGEASGEIHAARLMKALKAKLGNVEFHGLGGEAMIAEGLHPIADLKDISVVGFWEVAKKYSYFRALLRKCQDILKDGGFSAFIPVDYPGFNIRLASFAKENSIPVTYYIAPQLWAWGKNRAQKLAGAVDKLLVVFPFEVEYFRKFGIDTEFVGHPLLDDPVFDLQESKISDRDNLIALLPGSRLQEIKRHISLLEQTSHVIRSRDKDMRFGIARSNAVDPDIFNSLLPENIEWEIWDNTRELMKNSIAGVVKTGTSTLEAALCKMPFTMYYKTSAFTYYMGRYLVNLDNISLVNILLGRPLVRELIQHEADPNRIADEIIELANDDKRRENIIKGFNEVRNLLGESGASEKAAGIILKTIGL